ncbi:MAG: DUF4239 domain-containing protein [Acidobacteria bacterium]|nr:DUF4239 domain-containing protein [Acidobacteriota bacterium]
MLSLAENALMVLAVVGLSVLLFVVIDKVWPWDKRHQHNDVTGWQLGILGTTYAVILGFMLYAVWTEFDNATQNVEMEANSLTNVYRLADGLPEATRIEVQNLTRTYAQKVIENDWPEMEQGRTPVESVGLASKIQHALISVTDGSRSVGVAQDHAMTELSAMTTCRRTRLLENQLSLPAVLWCVLIVGGVLTIVSSCMFGSQNRFLHGLQMVFFSLMIALALLAIADINKPFRGSVHVGNDAFVRALENMK